jgi:hypothetical protein
VNEHVLTIPEFSDFFGKGNGLAALEALVIYPLLHMLNLNGLDEGAYELIL